MLNKNESGIEDNCSTAATDLRGYFTTITIHTIYLMPSSKNSHFSETKLNISGKRPTPYLLHSLSMASLRVFNLSGLVI